MIGEARWHRFTPAERAVRYAVYVGAAVAFVAALRNIEIIPEILRWTNDPHEIAYLVVRKEQLYRDVVREAASNRFPASSPGLNAWRKPAFPAASAARPPGPISTSP